MSNLLPEFEHPPVIEVALSIQFDRLDISMVQLGMVWERFRDRFPHVEEKPEISTAIERFGTTKVGIPGVRFSVGAVPSARLWFTNTAQNELVQVQRDRLSRNWRKTEGDPVYPRYNVLREAFVRDWQLFSEFVSEDSHLSLIPNQCEVTYANTIVVDKPGRLDQILSCIKGSFSDTYLNEPDHTEVRYRFVLQDELKNPWGRLHISATPEVRVADNQSVIRLTLTARGSPPTQDLAGSMHALDNGHEAVVRGFASITTPEMHSVWGRKSRT